MLCISYSIYSDGFWDERLVAVQLLLGFVQTTSQDSFVIPINLFLFMFCSSSGYASI